MSKTERFPFLLKIGDVEAARSFLLPLRGEYRNFTAWNIASYVFVHLEGKVGDRERLLAELAELPDGCEALCLPGEMPVMYENRGCVRSEKTGLSHRVFAAKLKPGCADEYKRRHSQIPPMPTDREDYESNWGIWLGDGHVFGYCELDLSLRREPTEEERNETVCWETAQLEIMDWLSDDMDWLTGERHEAVQQLL